MGPAIVVVLCVLNICLTALAGSEADAIRSTFEDYRKAVLTHDGRAAESLLSQTTVDYYAEMRKLALYASSESLQSQPLVTQMQVLLLRIRTGPERLEAMSGAELLAHSVEQGWIGKEGISRAQLGKLDIEESTAVAHAEINGQDIGPAFYFVKEARKNWRVDLLPTLETSNTALQRAAEQQGIPERDLILMLIESTVGYEVDAGAWNPPVGAP